MNKFILILFGLIHGVIYAQDQPKWMINPTIGFDLGTAVPFPTSNIPKGATFKPQITPALGVNFQNSIHPKWNLALDLHYRTLAFKGNANVVSQEFWNDDHTYVLYFSGEAKTNVKLQFIEIPISLYYKLSPKSSLILGAYYSNILKGKFDTEGNKGWISANKEDTDTAPLPGKQNTNYSFSENLSKYDIGALLGFQYQIHQRILITGKVNFGLKSIFKPAFQNLDYEMYQTRANISCSYVLFKAKN